MTFKTCKFVYKYYPGQDREQSIKPGYDYEFDVIVKEILYHEPQGCGDAHYCDVVFEGEPTIRIFNPDMIEFTE